MKLSSIRFILCLLALSCGFAPFLAQAEPASLVPYQSASEPLLGIDLRLSAVSPTAAMQPRTQATDEDLEGLEDLEDEEIVVEEGSVEQERSFGRILAELFSASVGASQINTGDGYRRYIFGEITFNYSRDWFLLKLQGERSQSEVEFELKKRTRNVGSGSDSPEAKRLQAKAAKKKFLYKDSSSVLREGYVQAKFGPFVFAGGLQTIVWGQFDLFSPVDFVLPRKSSSSGFGVGKVSSRLPQQVVRASWFVTPQIELQLYYFPQLTLDSLVEKSLNTKRDYYEPVGLTLNAGDPYNESKTYDYEDREVAVQKPKKDEEAQQGVRIMFYPSWATFGFTYYDGYVTDYAEDFPTLESKNLAFTYEQGYNYSPSNRKLPKTESRNLYYRKDAPKFENFKMVGFEISKRVGNWVWKGEVASRSGTTHLDVNPSSLNDPERNCSFYCRTPAQKEMLDWIQEKNKDRLYIDATQRFWAFGVDAEPGRWILNLTMYYIQEIVEPEAERGQELQKKAFPQNEDDVLNFAPGLNIGRYLGDGQDNLLGITAGIVSSGFGVALYFRQNFTDALSWGLSAESVEYFTDEDLEDLDGDGDYERETTTTSGVRLSMVYKF